MRHSVNKRNQEGFGSSGPHKRKISASGSRQDTGEEEKIEPGDNRSNVAPV